MSHVVTIELELKDLDAIKAACNRLGWQFLRAQRTYKWYGRWVKDYHEADAAYQHGIAPDRYGQCDHAIRIPGCDYEIGLIHDADKQLYKPIWDAWNPGGLAFLSAPGMGGFLQAYAVEKAKVEAKRNGFSCNEQLQENGTILVTATEAF